VESYQTVNRNGLIFARVKDTRAVVPVVGLGDFHLGAKTCDLNLIHKVIKWIKEHDAWWVGMGDFLEFSTKSSVGSGVYDQTMNPGEQIKVCVDLLQPIANRCIGLLKGNHEERGYKTDGNDPMATIAAQLKTNLTGSGSVTYFGWDGVFVISNPEKTTTHRSCYSFLAFHSYSGNKNVGLAMNWVEREVRGFLEGVDVVMKAHDHNRGLSPPDEGLVFNKSNLGIGRSKRYTVLTGHFLNWENSYASAKPMKPKPKGTVVLNLKMHREDQFITPTYLPEELSE
jgi:hypothetical protein